MTKEYLLAKLEEYNQVLVALRQRQREVVASIHQHEGAVMLLKEMLEKLDQEYPQANSSSSP